MMHSEADMSLPDETRLLRANTFNGIAELYDRGRRETPAHVFDDLFSLTGLDPASTSILEIGCGTGQATLPLARRGCSVVSVEMGANLARIARRNLSAFPHVSVVNARFEDWQPQRLFDVVFAVNAWRWVDPRLRYARAAQALRPDGVLAFTVGVHIFPEGFDPFVAEIQSLYEEIGVAQMQWPSPSPEQIEDARQEIEASELFDRVQVTRRIWTEEFTADEHVALMATASDHRLMEPAKREHLFKEMRRLIEARPGGRIRKHNLTLLHLARRKHEQSRK
jgi:SAM-dependent methyltransferase